MRLAVVIEGRQGEAGITPDLDRDTWPGGTEQADQPAQDRHAPSTSMGIARSEDGTDQLVGLPIEDQQWVEHVLAEVAMVAAPFLFTMCRIIRAIKVEQDVVRHTAGGAFLDVELNE
jgi:hypothetical protein